jgi:hypothetical protein
VFFSAMDSYKDYFKIQFEESVDSISYPTYEVTLYKVIKYRNINKEDLEKIDS